MADHQIPLSPLFRDPMLRAAFQRAERDTGSEPTFAAPPRKPVLTGGVAVQMEAA